METVHLEAFAYNLAVIRHLSSGSGPTQYRPLQTKRPPIGEGPSGRRIEPGWECCSRACECLWMQSGADAGTISTLDVGHWRGRTGPDRFRSPVPVGSWDWSGAAWVHGCPWSPPDRKPEGPSSHTLIESTVRRRIPYVAGSAECRGRPGRHRMRDMQVAKWAPTVNHRRPRASLRA